MEVPCYHDGKFFVNGTCFVCTSNNLATSIERERCAKVVEDFARAYPTTVFLEPEEGKHGQTVDACSARAIRTILPEVAGKIREGEE
jgi:hypothetical protein